MADSYDEERQRQAEEYAQAVDAHNRASDAANQALAVRDRLTEDLKQKREDFGGIMGPNRRRLVFVLADGRVLIAVWTPVQEGPGGYQRGHVTVTLDDPVGR